MVDPTLYEYVRDNVKRGVPVESIKDALRKSGHPPADIEEAIRAAQHRNVPSESEKISQQASSYFKSLKTFWHESVGRRLLRYTGHSQHSAPMTRPVTPSGSGQGVRSFHIPEKIKPYLPFVGLAVLLIFFVILVLISKAKPPVAVFFDNQTNSYVSGSVYFNEVYLGETKGTFNRLPKDFCEKEGKLAIVTKSGPVSWTAGGNDCKLKRLRLTVEIVPVQEVSFYVQLQFLTEESRELLGGTLSIDGIELGFITGTHEIYQGKCRTMRTINLTGIQHPSVPNGYAEWTHDPELCEHDVIRYKVPISVVEPTPPVFENKTDQILRMKQELEAATSFCDSLCPAAECSQQDKVVFCQKFIDSDLNLNDERDDFAPDLFGDFGVCEDRIYCSQIAYCQCDIILTFDSCIEVLCGEFLSLNMTVEQATSSLQDLLQEGSCQADVSYVPDQSWWPHYFNQGKLICTS